MAWTFLETGSNGWKSMTLLILLGMLHDEEERNTYLYLVRTDLARG